MYVCLSFTEKVNCWYGTLVKIRSSSDTVVSVSLASPSVKFREFAHKNFGIFVEKSTKYCGQKMLLDCIPGVPMWVPDIGVTH